MGGQFKRWSIAAGVILLSHLVLVFACALAWRVLGGTEFVAENLLRSDYKRNPSLVNSLVQELESDLHEAALAILGVTLVVAIILYSIAVFRTVDGPGVARRAQPLWWYLLIFGVLVTGGLSYYLFSYKASGLSPQLVLYFVYGSISAFVIVFYLAGSVLPMPRHIRPMVPGATLLMRT